MLQEQRRAVVTGATSGIGRAIARQLFTRGNGVYLVGRREERLHELQREANQHGVWSALRVTDLAAPAELDALCAELATDDLIRILVNAAGNGRAYGMVGALDATKLRDTIRVDLVAPMLLTNSIAPILKAAREGAVVTVGSLFATSVRPSWSVYGAAKHGLLGFTRTLRDELAEFGVRVIDVHPGSVNTEFGAVVAGIPPRRLQGVEIPYEMLEPEDVAHAVMSALATPARARLDELTIRAAGDR